MTIDFDALTAPFPPESIEWRVGPTNRRDNPDKGIALAYIDARMVMDRLDEVCTPAGWQDRYPHANAKTCCEIGILIDGEWIWKSDGAGDTSQDGNKGAFSDAFKRAAVRWGIGRYLYDIPNTWVAIKPRGKSYVIDDSELPRLRATLPNGKPLQPGAAVRSAATKPDALGALKADMGNFADRLKEVQTPDELETLLSEYQDALTDCKEKLPVWWNGSPKQPDVPGFFTRIETARKAVGAYMGAG